MSSKRWKDGDPGRIRGKGGVGPGDGAGIEGVLRNW